MTTVVSRPHAAMAAMVSAIGVLMASAAAFERGSTPTDRALITAAAVALALGAHMLPALARRIPAAWVLWAGCLLATLYGHAHFFSSASERAGAGRAASVTQTGQAQALASELESITARAVAVVATDHAAAAAKANAAAAALRRCEDATPGRCTSASSSAANASARLQAIAVELAQAQHAATLRTQIAALAAQHDAARSDAAIDPIDRAIIRSTGISESAIGLVIAISQSLLLELLAAVLWVLAINTSSAAARARHPSKGKPAPAISQRLASLVGWPPRPKARDRPWGLK